MLVRLRRRGAVGELRQDPGPDPLGVVGRDLALQGRRSEDVHLELQQGRVADVLRTRNAQHRAVLRLPGTDGLDVQALRPVDAALRIGDGHDPGAYVREQGGRRGTGVAEALDGHRGALDVQAKVARRLGDGDHTATAGGLGAAFRTTQADGLAGDHARHGVADMHGVGVHDPGHRLGVGVDIRRGDVLLGPDEHADLGRVAPRQPLQLTQRELLGVDPHAALATTIGDAHHGALPGHPHGQGADLVEGHVLVIAQAALGGTAAQVVLDAVAGEDLDAAIVHAHRHGHDELTLALAQRGTQGGIEIEPLSRDVELTLGDRPRIDDGRGLRSSHRDQHLQGRAPGRDR